MNKEVREYLIDIARQKDKFAYYSDVVKDCGLMTSIDLNSESGRAKFTKLLSDISEFEDNHHRPLLSSMAIYKDVNKNDHGDGFYIVAEKLKKGKFKKLKDDLYGFTEASECRKFWQDEEKYQQFARVDEKKQPNKVARLFEALIIDREFDGGWKDIYIDFVRDVKKLQKALSEQPQLGIDNNKLYANLSRSVRSYEAFMMKLLKEHRNGISSRGQSVLSGEHFKKIICDPAFKVISKVVISNPTIVTYNLLMDWWYGNEEISNRPLLINRALAACLPERLSSTVDTGKFWFVISVLQKEYGFQLSDQEHNWFTANVELTGWLDNELKGVIEKTSVDILEQQIWRNIFVWFIYKKYYDKPTIPANELIRRDPPDDGYAEMPQSSTSFEGRDVNFEQKAKAEKELGDAGETLVMLHEIKQLEDWKMYKQAKLVRIAKHGEGYDVYSYDKAGQERFIEVKTTTGKSHNRFYLTRHEIKFMQENHANYSLYRVYNYDEENNSGEFFELKGDIESQVIWEPTQYEVVIKKK